MDDFTAYLMKGRTKTHALFTVVSSQENKCLNAGAYVEMGYHVTYIFEVLKFSVSWYDHIGPYS